MEDWAYGLAIILCTVIWVHIFVDYRKKLMRVMPGVEQVASRKSEFRTKISETRTNAEDIVGRMQGLRQEIQALEERRQELQSQLNKHEMILIPAGRFNMGSNLPGRDEENPEHRVTLKSFYLDRFEVINLQYKDFVDATGHRLPVHWLNGTFPTGKGDHPVVNVSWEDARAYAEWASKRLPTEAEWEYAARGPEGREYPWGKQCSPKFANFANPDSKTTPVNKFPEGKSPFGVWDMCGNVCEWINDWYDPKYYPRSPESNPPGPDGGRQKVYRGGGFQGNRMDLRAAARHFGLPTAYQDYIGFRCAMDAE